MLYILTSKKKKIEKLGTDSIKADTFKLWPSE